MIKRLLKLLGFHFHDWSYYGVRGEHWRQCCSCKKRQVYVFVPAAPGAFGGWCNEDEV